MESFGLYPNGNCDGTVHAVVLQCLWISADECGIFCRLYDEMPGTEMGLETDDEERLSDAVNRLSGGRMVVYSQRDPV